MARFLTNEVLTSDSFIHVYQDINDNDLANEVSKIMVSRGYKLKEGTIINGAYEKGDRTLRLLFGAFSKYFKFNVSVENMRVKLSTGTSGFSGGVLGIGQVRDETKILSQQFQEI